MAETMRAAVKGAIEDDVTLASLLSGGVYDRRGISRTLTPAAFDANGSILPCAVVTVEAFTSQGHRENDFERAFVLVWLYEQNGSGYASIDQARLRVREVLNNASLQADDGAIHTVTYVGGIGDSYDDVLDAEMTHLRFTIDRHTGEGLST